MSDDTTPKMPLSVKKKSSVVSAIFSSMKNVINGTVFESLYSENQSANEELLVL